LPREQLSTCGVPLTEHVPGPEYDGLIDQVMSPPVGRGSSTVTDSASPVFSDAFSGFETVTVNPIAMPALTEGASAALASARFGISTEAAWIWLSRLPTDEPSTA